METGSAALTPAANARALVEDGRIASGHDALLELEACVFGITGSTDLAILGDFNDDAPPNTNWPSGGRDGMTFCFHRSGSSLKHSAP